VAQLTHRVIFNCDGVGEIDETWPRNERGRPVERTRTEFPHSYDPYVVWRAPEGTPQTTSTVYSDRLYEWDSDRFDKLSMKHFGNVAQLWWNSREPSKIQAFLRDYQDNQHILLTLIMDYCNRTTGCPTWRFDYHMPFFLPQ